MLGEEERGNIDPSGALDLGFRLYSASKGEILGAVAAMKKGKSPGAGEADRARLRHRILLEEHEDLVEETKGKRKKLEMANQKKFKLVAEVKFLHKRYKSLLQNPSRTIQFRVKKKPKSRINISQPSDGNASSRLPANNQGRKLRDAAIPTTSAAIDLNEASLPISEDMDDYQFIVESDKFRKRSQALSLSRCWPWIVKPGC